MRGERLQYQILFCGGEDIVLAWQCIDWSNHGRLWLGRSHEALLWIQRLKWVATTPRGPNTLIALVSEPTNLKLCRPDIEMTVKISTVNKLLLPLPLQRYPDSGQKATSHQPTVRWLFPFRDVVFPKWEDCREEGSKQEAEIPSSGWGEWSKQGEGAKRLTEISANPRTVPGHLNQALRSCWCFVYVLLVHCLGWEIHENGIRLS